MTERDDAVDAVIEAFLDYLDGLGGEPSLDDLDREDRRRAEDLIASLKAGRGINPYASRPSVERMLAGTDFEELLRHEPDHGRAAIQGRDLLDEIRTNLTELASLRMEVVPDVAAAAARHVQSDFVVFVGPHRLRIQIRADVTDPAALAAIDPAAAAGPIYGRFPDTAGVVLLYPDVDLSSVVIDPFDPEYSIETPSGAVATPAARRPVMALSDTVRSYLDEIAPALDLLPSKGTIRAADLDSDAIAQVTAARVIAMVVAEGGRAQIDAKKETWSALGATEAEGLAALVVEALSGRLDEDDLDTRMTALIDAA